MPNVMIVPETEEYHHHVSHHGLVWITKKLGIPDLGRNNAMYIAPFWIGENEGVNRVFYILSVRDRPQDNDTEFQLGNSFTCETWTGLNQRRKFEYRPLEVFGLRELQPGILVPIG